MSGLGFGGRVVVRALTYRRRTSYFHGAPGGWQPHGWHLVQAHGGRTIPDYALEGDMVHPDDQAPLEVVVPAPTTAKRPDIVCDVVRLPCREPVEGIVIGRTHRQAGYAVAGECGREWTGYGRVSVYVVALDPSEIGKDGAPILRRQAVVDVHPNDLHANPGGVR